MPADQNPRCPAGAAQGNQKWRILLCLLGLLAVLLALPLSGGMESGMVLSLPEQVRPYLNTDIQLEIPADGTLTLTARIFGEEYPILQAQAVFAGPLTLAFSGLSMNGEPLPAADALMVARLQTGSRVISAQAAFRVLQPAAGLNYVVLSRESLPRFGGEDLYADHQLSRAGELMVKLYRKDSPDQPLFSRAFTRKDSLPHTYRWDKTIAGQPAPAGEYVMTFEVRGSSQEALKRPFTLAEDAPNETAVSVSPPGAFLPKKLDDTSVWEAMTAPLTVVNIGDLQHQAIFRDADSASPALGQVHGQTAGLEVLETDINGFALVRTARHGDGAWVTGYVPLSKLKVIQPDSRYGLLINKDTQTLTVYEKGKALGTLPVSTGVYVPPGTDSFDTLPGAFLTQDRIAEFSSEGFRYPYAVRIDGGNLIHSAGYALQNGARDYSVQREELGQKASHGCVRVDNRADDAGINAWWLYANLPRNTKVLVIQAELPTEIRAPEQEEGREGAPEDIQPAAMEKTTRVTLTFGGDSVLGSEERARKLPESFHSIVASKGDSWPFSGLSEIFHQDDLTLINLENVLKDSADGLEESQHNFRGPTAFVNILKTGGIDLVNLANNHFPDYGQAGKNSTRRALRDAGIPFAGYSGLYVFEKDGIRIGFAGIRETVFHQNRGRIADEIAELQRRGCRYIVYSCHFGTEYEEKHNELQTLIARTAIDAGAGLVIGHHPHVVQGIEEYRGGLIFYSLGNLVFGGNLELSTFDGLLAQVSLDFDREQALKQTSVRLIPIITSSSRPANDFRPIPATGQDKQRILETIQNDSTLPIEESFIMR